MLLLFLILIRDITFASTLAVAQKISPHYGLYIIIFYILQILASPFQAAYSDRSCRKRSLLFAFIVITVGHLFLFCAYEFNMPIYLLICVLINGLFGNVFPIAVAGLMDINYLNNTKRCMTFVSAALAIAWLSYVYGVIYMGLLPFFWLSTGMCLFSVILCYFFFEDKRDRDPSKGRINFIREYVSIRRMSTEKFFMLAMKFYLFSEITYYGLFYFHINEDAKNFILIVSTYACGYIVGNLIINYAKVSLKKGIILGFIITIISSLSLIVFDSLGHFKHSFAIFIALETLFSLGYGIFDPCFYAFVGETQLVHRRGKAFGIVDSIDNFSEGIVSLFIFSIPLTTTILFFFRVFGFIFLIIGYLAILYAFKLNPKIANSVK